MQKFVGLDVHKAFIYAVVLDKEGNQLFERKLKSHPHEIDSLLSTLDPKETTIAIEACSTWQYVYDYLFDSGYHGLVLANPIKVRLIAESKKKTDRYDANTLAELLRVNMLPQSYAAPRDVREQRQITRHRASLVRIRTEIKNKVHAILLRHGIDYEYSDVFGQKGIEYLKSLDLPACDRFELDQYIALIETINGQIKDNNELITDYADAHPHARLIMTVPGVDYYSALTICGEIGDVHRFPHVKKLVSFAGLNPSVYQSGSTLRMGHISKQGNRNLRWILVQCANVAIRYDPWMAAYYRKLVQKKHHNVAIVAVARKMLERIYTMMKLSLPYHALQVNRKAS